MNEFEKFLQSDTFKQAIDERVGTLAKADTVDQNTGLVWYDLSRIVQEMHPFKQLIPLISSLPRVPADGGTAHRWKRVTGINVNNVSIGVPEGERAAASAITVQDQLASYKTMGLEGSVSWEARLAALNLKPDAQGVTIQATLQGVMIGEEQTLIGGNASTPLGITPTPTLTAAGTTSALSNVPYYLVCVALSHAGWRTGSMANGIPGQVTLTSTTGTITNVGGGSAQPSAQATITPTAGQIITATVTPVVNAVAYAWYFGTTTGAARLQGITTTNQAKFSSVPSTVNQLITALQVNGAFQDNSTNTLLPDGILSQINGSVSGSAPGTAMATNPNLPVVASGTLGYAGSGALIFQGASGNAGLTIAGTSIVEFDAVFQAAYDQYKIGFDRILVSSTDLNSNIAQFLNTASTNNSLRMVFEADSGSGSQIVAGRAVNAYKNKIYGNTLPIETHPNLPPGTILFWSDRSPYPLSGVANILEARVRQDYVQVSWPLRTRRNEYGVYVDETFALYFAPAFAILTNINQPTGTQTF